MTIMQRTLDGNMQIAGLTAIQRQLAQIMWDHPETQTDEDLLAAKWLIKHTAYGGDLSDLIGEPMAVIVLRAAARSLRTRNIRERRRELHKMGLFPWPKDEAERRQRRSRQGAPGVAR